jgi:Na+-translocating ferredoxin:NAD+ oxidoreductase RnfD subunit
MTATAVVTTFAFSAIYYAATGSYYFVDSHVPIAVFLGMHLLFTDPSTSPRSEIGRVLYGVLYGLTVVSCTTCCCARTRRASTTSCCRCRCSICP